ncbi:FCS-Like Zinc finger 5-like [Musa acuminata AAA Group]|uniref:FCS-Like Zinc finger 5-like n=1 Tax=Musa acuminata AAA Group TaxID=214697 RepID=UPI0031DA6CF9
MAEGTGEGVAAAILLGKRTRQPMRRTTSMTEFSLEDVAAAAEGREGIRRHHKCQHRERRRGPEDEGPPRIVQRWSFGDLGTMETTTKFLMACGFCNRCLGPGFDTFIYRGEIAFCSLECRQNKINQDEIRDKHLRSKKTNAASTAVSETSGDGQRAVAA